MVAAASRTVFTQEAARGQWRQVADGLRARFARLARVMDEAKDDVLAYMTLHPDHWTRIRTLCSTVVCWCGTGDRVAKSGAAAASSAGLPDLDAWPQCGARAPVRCSGS